MWRRKPKRPLTVNDQLLALWRAETAQDKARLIPLQAAAHLSDLLFRCVECFGVKTDCPQARELPKSQTAKEPGSARPSIAPSNAPKKRLRSFLRTILVRLSIKTLIRLGGLWLHLMLRLHRFSRRFSGPGRT